MSTLFAIKGKFTLYAKICLDFILIYF